MINDKDGFTKNVPSAELNAVDASAGAGEKGTETGRTDRTGSQIFSANNKNFRCAGCGSIIFLAKDRAELRTGRPAFTEAVEGSVELVEDRRHGAVRAFVRCSKCGRHLGQIVDDGAGPGSRKYCMNCGALDFRNGLQRS